MSDLRYLSYPILEDQLLAIGLQVLEKIGDDYDLTYVSLAYLLGEYLAIDQNILYMNPDSTTIYN